MEFDKLLDKLWMYDIETFAHDTLVVFINYRTKEEVYFHNNSGDDIYSWLQQTDPILVAYNCNNYDKHILRCWISGMSPEELKTVNDYIISGNNGWDYDVGYVELPIMWDLFNEINPRKALKEIEGNLRLPITESSVPFDLPTKLTEEQFKEVLYYCEHDVQALFPIFDMLQVKYKSKYIIAKLGKLDIVKSLAMTDANLTAALLGGVKKQHDDNFIYTIPRQVDKDKIPNEYLEYIQDVIEHNDLNYKPEAPLLDLDTINFQVGLGGGHGFIKDGVLEYDRGDIFECE